MKLFVNARFLTQPVTGVQRYAIECCLQIQRMLPDTVFLTPAEVLHTDIAQILNAQVVKGLKGHLWEQWTLPRFLKKQGNPLLLNLANTAPIGYNNNLITIHDIAYLLHPEWNSKTFAAWYNFMIPKIAANAKHIFTVSGTVKSELVKYLKVNSNTVSVTCNGLGGIFTSYEPSKKYGKEKIILAVGTINQRKNQKTLIEAFLKSDLATEWKLMLYGNKSSLFSDTGIDFNELQKHNIQFVEQFSDSDLVEAYSKAAVVASLSLYEGFGIPILEGMNFGCKIICSDILVYRELFDGFADFCNISSVEKVVEQLNRLKSVDLEATQDYKSIIQKYTFGRAAKVVIESIKTIDNRAR